MCFGHFQTKLLYSLCGISSEPTWKPDCLRPPGHSVPNAAAWKNQVPPSPWEGTTEGTAPGLSPEHTSSEPIPEISLEGTSHLNECQEEQKTGRFHTDAMVRTGGQGCAL